MFAPLVSDPVMHSSCVHDPPPTHCSLVSRPRAVECDVHTAPRVCKWDDMARGGLATVQKKSYTPSHRLHPMKYISITLPHARTLVCGGERYAGERLGFPLDIAMVKHIDSIGMQS